MREPSCIDFSPRLILFGFCQKHLSVGAGCKTLILLVCGCFCVSSGSLGASVNWELSLCIWCFFFLFGQNSASLLLFGLRLANLLQDLLGSLGNELLSQLGPIPKQANKKSQCLFPEVIKAEVLTRDLQQILGFPQSQSCCQLPAETHPGRTPLHEGPGSWSRGCIR